MSESDSFYSHATRKEYKINYLFNCDLSGVGYLLDSVVCSVQYMGSTKTPLKLRHLILIRHAGLGYGLQLPRWTVQSSLIVVVKQSIYRSI